MYRENYGLDYAVLRYPNVYGPRQDPHGEAGVVAIFTGQMLADEQVVVYGDGEQTRDFVHVADCARANLLAVSSQSTGIFNIGSGRGTTVNQIFATLQEIIGYRGEPVFGPPKLGETREIYLDATRAGEMLGWKPKLNLKDGLESTVAYFRESEVSVGQGG
jgi:UDP-glucose 4-epimerase